MAEGKFYWLKLKRDFFKRHDIRIIEEMPNGKDYVLFYLKLLLESIDHEGSLRFSDTIPYNEQMLSVVTNTNVDTVRAAMDLFIALQLVEVKSDKTIYMEEVGSMIGSETKWAEKKRLQRQKDNVPLLSSNCPIEIEKEEEIEKELDTDIEIEREIESSAAQSTETSLSTSSTDLSTKEETARKMLGGELGKGVVFLSQSQIDDLLEKLSLEEFDYYVGVVADCILKGKQYKRKTHYQAILDMALADRKVK